MGQREYVEKGKQNFCIIMDFVSDWKVLQLNSSDMMSKIFDSQNQDSNKHLALCLTLFFMCVHLFAVNNCKGNLLPQERVGMMWSYLIFFLLIEGVHPIAKRNWLMECILRNDVI
jgi:hypothetical protein